MLVCFAGFCRLLTRRGMLVNGFHVAARPAQLRLAIKHEITGCHDLFPFRKAVQNLNESVPLPPELDRPMLISSTALIDVDTGLIARMEYGALTHREDRFGFDRDRSIRI